MKLIKKYDENGNEYFEEILETNEEIKKNVESAKIRRKKKLKRKILFAVFFLLIIIISGLSLFNKISLSFLGNSETLISFIMLFVGIAGLEEASRR